MAEQLVPVEELRTTSLVDFVELCRAADEDEASAVSGDESVKAMAVCQEIWIDRHIRKRLGEFLGQDSNSMQIRLLLRKIHRSLPGLAGDAPVRNSIVWARMFFTMSEKLWD